MGDTETDQGKWVAGELTWKIGVEDGKLIATRNNNPSKEGWSQNIDVFCSRPISMPECTPSPTVSSSSSSSSDSDVSYGFIIHVGENLRKDENGLVGGRTVVPVPKDYTIESCRQEPTNSQVFTARWSKVRLPRGDYFSIEIIGEDDSDSSSSKSIVINRVNKDGTELNKKYQTYWQQDLHIFCVGKPTKCLVSNKPEEDSNDKDDIDGGNDGNEEINSGGKKEEEGEFGFCTIFGCG